MQKNQHVARWVAEVTTLCTPAGVVWCDGSEDERQRLTAEAVRTGVLITLNQDKLPGCYLHRSHPSDVARTEHLTFVCPENKDDAGPNNNWMPPAEAKTKVGQLFNGAMKGRTLYVVPFLMGPPGSPFSKVGVEITDSIYVVLNMRIMTRMGAVALDHLGESDDFTRCLHSLGDLSPDRRFVLHFPQSNEIWSIGSGYGGNALLGKKCLALRIASVLGRDQGWLAEHMLIVGITTPEGKKHYVTGAFPSACGKTNLAMLVPPATMHGWKIETVGDDIAWLRPGTDGRLRDEDHRQQHHLHERGAAPRWYRLVGRSRRSARSRHAGLAGAPLEARRRREGGAPELALHGAGVAVPDHLAGVGEAAGRSHLGHSVRRPPPAPRAAGVRSAVLAARDIFGRDAVV